MRFQVEVELRPKALTDMLQLLWPSQKRRNAEWKANLTAIDKETRIFILQIKRQSNPTIFLSKFLRLLLHSFSICLAHLLLLPLPQPFFFCLFSIHSTNSCSSVLALLPSLPSSSIPSFLPAFLFPLFTQASLIPVRPSLQVNKH